MFSKAGGQTARSRAEILREPESSLLQNLTHRRTPGIGRFELTHFGSLCASCDKIALRVSDQRLDHFS